MLHPTYEVRNIRSRPLGGVTGPSSCTLEGVMKFDGDESPYCVYNEAVGVRLAQTLHAPIADGVLTSSGDGPAFVSLYVAAPPERLPNIHWSRRDKIASKYRVEVAALIAFDIFIGNGDRFRNIKASLANPQLYLFRGFDHSHALLTTGRTPADSLAALASEDIIAERHPFYGFVDLDDVAEWAKRIKATPDTMIAECCEFNRDFRSATQAMQRNLAIALVKRKSLLPKIIRRHRAKITTIRVKEEG